MRFRLSRALGAALCAAFGLAGPSAFGAPVPAPQAKQECVASFEQAQEEQKRGKLLRARELALSCVENTCGKVLMRECSTLLDEIRPRIPTIVLSLADASGASVSEAQVTIDGTPLVSELDGRAVSVDPGTHKFVFTTADGRRAERSTEVRLGTQKQAIDAVLAADPRPASASAVPASDAPPVKRKKRKKARSGVRHAQAEPSSMTLPYVFGGVGLAGVAGFIALASVAKSENQKLSSCWPDCPDQRVERVRTLYIGADVSLGVGVAALGTGLVLALTSGSSRPREQAKLRSRTAYRLDLRHARGGLTAGVSGSF